MPLTSQDWQAIFEAIQTGAFHPSEFKRDVVTKRDPLNRLIWTQDMGIQPIPIYSFNYIVTYFDEEPAGYSWPVVGDDTIGQEAIVERITEKKFARVEVEVPLVGETVLLALHYGSLRLPKCLGVLRSKGFIIEDDFA